MADSFLQNINILEGILKEFIFIVSKYFKLYSVQLLVFFTIIVTLVLLSP